VEDLMIHARATWYLAPGLVETAAKPAIWSSVVAPPKREAAGTKESLLEAKSDAQGLAVNVRSARENLSVDKVDHQ
jgi:hypothetical protein